MASSHATTAEVTSAGSKGPAIRSRTAGIPAAACTEALTRWRDALTEAIAAHGAPLPDAASLATLVLAGMEGALLLSRAARDPGPLRTVGAELATTLRARLRS
jgi:hypothetical protein